MFGAILVLLIMPFTDLSRNRGIQFRPLSKISFFIFIANFLILMLLGAKHVEAPFIEAGQISTVLYFAHFLIIVPVIGLLENSLIELDDKLQHLEKYNDNNIILRSSIFSKHSYKRLLNMLLIFLAYLISALVLLALLALLQHYGIIDLNSYFIAHCSGPSESDLEILHSNLNKIEIDLAVQRSLE